VNSESEPDEEASVNENFSHELMVVHEKLAEKEAELEEPKVNVLRMREKILNDDEKAYQDEFLILKTENEDLKLKLAKTEEENQRLRRHLEQSWERASIEWRKALFGQELKTFHKRQEILAENLP